MNTERFFSQRELKVIQVASSKGNLFYIPALIIPLSPAKGNNGQIYSAGFVSPEAVSALVSDMGL